MSMNNDVTHILIEGILGLERDWYDTSYRDIAEKIHKANQGKAQKIVLEINSPGGSCAGIDVAIHAIKSSKIPVTAFITGICASAAYNLACSTQYITAAGPNTFIGSIGTYSSWIDDKKYMDANGLEEWIVISKGSPKKIAQTKEEFVAQEAPLVEESFRLFVANVAQGRRVSEEKVLSDFGQGALMMAEAALAVGMIDEIIKVEEIKEQGETNMEEDQVVNMLLADPEKAIEIIQRVCAENENIAMAIKSHLDLQLKDTEESDTDKIAEKDETQPVATIKNIPSAKKDVGYVGSISQQKPIAQSHEYYQKNKQKYLQRTNIKGK